ncbi:uncharacterized protein PV09_05434 [Verruconis gallopava]|uniref:Uncharacterized protein n=1 Tax=Verruconis gallopava TaxID=253628 RepID=A0A0D2AVN0_9PEZI|nr:uncharacterized protein PV09_05434 [Verruconis gallopava]KIW03209.1 hypothetical protein PV09_05434 [Verruconis gallopava]
MGLYNCIFCTSTVTTPLIRKQLVSYLSAAPRTCSSTLLSRAMSTSNLRIENTNLQTAPGVELSQQQKTLVGSVLDLFQGKPTKEKLQLWEDDATFEDPLTIAKGRKKYEPQWYGLQQAFSEIERLSHQVVSSGNPIIVDLKTRYKVKGIGKETTVSSKVNIFTSPDGSKISRVEDKWDGKLPDSSIADIFRKLNSITVPYLVSIPKSAEEEMKTNSQP